VQAGPALTPAELRRESRAKVFNSYFGSLSNFLVPVTVVALTAFVGWSQRTQDARTRDNELTISRQSEREGTRRECLSQMRETAKMWTQDAGERRAAYEKMVLSVAGSLNEVCGPVGISLPSVLLEEAQRTQADPTASPAAKETASRLISSQPLRLFMQIGRESDRARARVLERMLEQSRVDEAPIVVPGIELVTATPRVHELRYANRSEAETAEKLAQQVSALLNGERVVPKPIAARNVAPRTFELWLAAK
jgi:hypothetical protein